MVCVPWQADPGCCDSWGTYPPELQDRALTLAWSTLRLLTGGLVGYCATTMRPCVQSPCSICHTSMYQPWMMVPTLTAGEASGYTCGGSGCSCVQLSEVVLPGKVALVESVLLDGMEMPDGTWRLDGNRLLRTDGDVWPSCQDMRLPATAVGAFAVNYVPGVDPGAAGSWAAGVLACEYAKACTGGKCRLPASVVSIARQGVAMQFDNSLFSNGLTGIREVDGFVLSLNPHSLKVPPRVWSPDVTHGRATSETVAP